MIVSFGRVRPRVTGRIGPIGSVGLPLLAVVCLLVFPVVLRLLYGQGAEMYLPGPNDLLLGVIAVALIVPMARQENRFIAWIWLGWYFVGCLNALSSYFELGTFFRSPLAEPTRIYFGFMSAMCLGVLVGERVGSQSSEPFSRTTRRLGKIQIVVLVGATFVWAASLLYSVGFVPVLSGADITETMYHENYGPLYGYGFVTVVAAPALLLNLFRARTSRQRGVVAVLLMLVMMMSLMDGKRYFAILMMLSACFLIQRRFGLKQSMLTICGVLVAALVMYAVLLVARQGGDVAKYSQGWTAATSVAGVEFRDFAYTVTRFDPGSVPGYSWLSSAAAAAVNADVLEALGFDKTAMIEQGSAASWSRIFGADFGIRTGIASELWFAYGWWGLPVMGVIGFLTARIVQGLRNADSEMQLINRSTVLALIVSLVMGQTTAVTGLLTVLLYINLLLCLVRLSIVTVKARRPGLR